MKVTVQCEDAIPSHSYVYFDGRSGGATVDTESGIVWHHPNGRDYECDSFADLYVCLSSKGTNRMADYALMEIGDALGFDRLIEDGRDGFLIPDSFPTGGGRWLSNWLKWRSFDNRKQEAS